MGKATNYTNIKNLGVRITFNQEKRVDEDEKYVPMLVRIMGDVVTSDGAIKRLLTRHEVGNLVESPLTFKQIYNNVPAVMQPFLKDFVIEAIDEDVSK